MKNRVELIEKRIETFEEEISNRLGYMLAEHYIRLEERLEKLESKRWYEK